MVLMKNAGDTRKPYSGLSRSLVIAIDVGTTFSGVSYAILEPGEIPKIHGVTRFPGQEHVAGNSKIPSVIYYDKNGTIMAAGAEADSSSIVAQAEDDGWIKAELFKLRLRPRQMQLNMNGMRLSPLPRGKSPVHVFGDYLGYLYACTRSFISDTHANGAALWASVESDIQFVLSHPNGWEGPQQTRMRKAAVHGRLVPDTDAGRARIRFVTEGEASLHACVLSGLANDVLSNPSKHGFLIADAGGGTLDISSYAIKGTSPLAMEEIAPPDCIFAGSVFVSRRAREFLEDRLKYSKYGTPDALDHITRKFDETTKRLFRDRNEMQFIPFGSPLDKDSAVGIRNGQLRLSGNEVANLFEPSVDAAVNAIKNQIEASHGMIRSVFLVGGYAASPWLFGQLQVRLAPYKITVSRPDTQTSKAVADGAIGFYCDHHVSARMSKFMYGVEFLRELDPSDPDHLARKEKLCELPSGPKLLPDAFDCILARSVKVKESTVFTRKYCTELTNLSMLSVFEVEIWCYRGGDVVPKWINRHEDVFSTLCVVQADLSMLNGSAEPKAGKNGKKYWTIVFSVEIHFGLTEFKARIKWMDNGQVKYGPAVIVYNERGSRLDDDDGDLYPEDDGANHNATRDRQRSSPASRSRAPIEPQYPPATGSGSRRTSTAGTLETPRMERTPSKGYSPSVAPSHRSAYSTSRNDVAKGSDGERGSDSDRRRYKDKAREIVPEDRPRGFGPSSGAATPVERSRSVSTTYGTPTIGIAQVPSSGSNEGAHKDMLSTTWAAPPAADPVPSRSPSVRPSQSRSPSIYGTTAAPADSHSPAYEFSAPPQSAVSEHRQSHLWDGPPAALHSPGAADRSRSPFVDKVHSPAPPSPAPRSSHFLAEAASGRPPSVFVDEPAYGRPASTYDHDTSFGRPASVYAADASQSRPRSPYAPSQADRPKSPFVQEPPSAIGRSVSPFVDRPKSGVEGSFFGDRPKSAFGDAPAIFGDSGPAADIGQNAGASLFGDPPASVFGDAAGGGAFDSWGLPAAVAPAAASPAPSTKSGKSKRKGSAAATPSMPASGLASHTSPTFGAGKSPFGRPQDIGLFDEPAVVAAAVSTSPGMGLWGSKAPSPAKDKERGLSPLNPASQLNEEPSGGGLWGSKAPSPMDKNKDKALSPLNPVAQMHDEPAAAASADSWGFDTKGASTAGETWGSKGGDAWGASGGDSWNDTGLGDPPAPEIKVPSKVPSRAPSPVPVTPVAETPVAETPVDETPKESAAGGKKKKKKGGAATKAANVEEDKEAERKKAEAAQAEADKKAEEEKAAADKAEAERVEAERLAELDRQEEAATAAKAAAEEERRMQEESDRLARELAALEAERAALEKAENDRKETEAREKEEREEKERLEAKEKEAKEKEKREREEREKLEANEKEKEKVAEPASLFGNPTSLFSGGHFSSSSLNPPDQPWVATDTGGGDDSWGSWGGTPTATGKKKKGKGGTTPTAAKPSAFGFGGAGAGWGSLGASLTADDVPKDDPVTSPKPSPKSPTTELPSSTGIAIDFGSTNMNFGFGDSLVDKAPSEPPLRVLSRAPSPAPVIDEAPKTPAELADPADATSPTDDAADALDDLLAGDGEAEKEEDEGAAQTSSSKKKKKKKGGAAEANDTPAATPVEETAPAEPSGGGGGGAKKKKKKK